MNYEKYLNILIIEYRYMRCHDLIEGEMPPPYYFIDSGAELYVQRLCTKCLEYYASSRLVIEQISYEDLRIIEKSNYYLISVEKVKTAVKELGIEKVQKLINEVVIEDVIK